MTSLPKAPVRGDYITDEKESWLYCVFQDVEKELEAQIGMRQEMELAMKMLEKDVCEKQDALVALRQQLDDLRALKHELSFKLQVRKIIKSYGMSSK